MNPAFLYFASGESLYAGASLLFVAIVISLSAKLKMARAAANATAFVAFALVAMACPPFSWSLDGIFLASFVVWLIAPNDRRGWQATAWQRLSSVVLLMALLLLTAAEFFHRRMPTIAGSRSDHLVVIGDSISSGIDPRVPSWPSVFQQLTGVPTKNLSRAGAQIADGRRMAEEVTRADHLVLIELGGNDLLGGVSSAVFAKNLEATFSKLAQPERTIVMLELPLLPNKIACGHVQRHLAAKYGVWLIPKRYFIEVIAGPASTSDGLHLSAAGSRRMATLVAQALSPVLQSQAESGRHR